LNAQLRHVRRRTAGFSLVEIMVGMVIGMFGIIIMMQVFGLAETQKRATTSGGDAQTSGAIALFGLQRDIRQAGLGVSDVKITGCNLLLRAGVTLNVMAPVTINHASIPAGDANTDTLLVVYGNSNGSPQGDGISSQPAAASYAVQTPTSHVIGDKVIAAPQTRASPCNLVLDSVLNIVTPNVVVSTGVAAMSNGTLFNLGQSPKILAYAVRGGNLTVCDYTVNDCSAAGSTGSSTVWVPVASNIVSMKAQYGKDTNTPMDGVVDTYNQVALASACDIAKTSSIRIALVARSAEPEKNPTSTSAATTWNVITTAAPTWEASVVSAAAPTNPTAVPIDLTALANLPANATWQSFRYRVFQGVVPVRNVAWQGVQTGC
jgi:type IV pilus assembly protein PilW